MTAVPDPESEPGTAGPASVPDVVAEQIGPLAALIGDWHDITAADPVGVAGLHLLPVIEKLQEFQDLPDFGDYWKSLNARQMLDGVTAPAATAIINWYRNADRDSDDDTAHLRVLTGALRQAAGVYENVTADLRGLRLSPAMLARFVAPDDDYVEDLIDDIAGTLLIGFWALLGEQTHRYATAFTSRGIAFQAAPQDREGRGALLAAALRNGVAINSHSGRLGRLFPDDAHGWAMQTPSEFHASMIARRVVADPRAMPLYSQSLTETTLPAFDEAHVHLRDDVILSVAAAEPLHAPLSQHAPLIVPWLLRTPDGASQGGLILDDDETPTVLWTRPSWLEEAPVDPIHRRVMAYAGEHSDDRHGASKAMLVILSAVLHDLSDAAVRAGHFDIGLTDDVAAQPRQARRRMQRDLDEGRGAGVLRLRDQPEGRAFSAVRDLTLTAGVTA